MPVNADAPDVDVELVEVEDDIVNPLGVKGVGEIGQVGAAAAIANAVLPRHRTPDPQAADHHRGHALSLV